MKNAIDTLIEKIEEYKVREQALIELSNAQEYYYIHEIENYSSYMHQTFHAKRSQRRLLNGIAGCKRLGITGLDILEGGE